MMNTIESQLSDLAKDCRGVEFKFEYDPARERVLISYSIPSSMNDDDVFWDKLLELKQWFNREWTENHPLFCENERLFSLSPNAKLISSCTIDTIEAEFADSCGKRPSSK